MIMLYCFTTIFNHLVKKQIKILFLEIENNKFQIINNTMT